VSLDKGLHQAKPVPVGSLVRFLATQEMNSGKPQRGAERVLGDLISLLLFYVTKERMAGDPAGGGRNCLKDY
jgi:hypothetical protein